ncbi:MAG: hypothetical protein IPN42_03795 [Methylococcaceae bacterium]|nr:hypothetical protein [Methylococcaceae bacterium]
MSAVKQLFKPKDFIETAEGLCFAVVQFGVECSGCCEKVLCFLRYIKFDDDNHFGWRKVKTDIANTYLKQYFPHYLHHSEVLDADLHAVEVRDIVRHYKPRERLQFILASLQRDSVEQDLFELCRLFQRNGLDIAQIGVTGSLLIGVQQSGSDIDLVFYDRDLFHHARKITAHLIESGKLSDLDETDWQASFDRRSCALSLADYVWHERRKCNKALINGRKFDLNLVAENVEQTGATYKKCGATVIQCKIVDDRYGFDYPAMYSIDHAEIRSVVCFIATYTGQAFKGETVEIAGLVEQGDDGVLRIVVGSSREAPGEYIKVMTCLD